MLCLVFYGIGPGLFVVRLLPDANLPERGVLALVSGTMIWAVAIFISHATERYATRFLIVYAIEVASLCMITNPKASVRNLPHKPGSLPTITGATVGFIATLPMLLRTLSVQKTTWTGYWMFNIDTPFQVALVSEAAQRVPQVYPYADDTQLRYTWLTHASLGFWSRVSQVSAFEVVLRFWPVLAVVLINLLVAALTWRISKNQIATVVAPLLMALIRGPKIGSSTYLDFHVLAPYSPSRDLGSIWLLAFVLFLAHKSSKTSRNPFQIARLTTVALFSFCLSGGKGSTLPLVLGALLVCTAIFVLKRHRHVADTLAVLATTLFGLMLGQRFVVNSSGHMIVEPFSFIDALPSASTTWAIYWTVPLAILSIAVVLHTLNQLATEETLGRLTVGILPLLGLGGLVLFGHPGMSQIYFWTLTAPFLCIGLACMLSEVVNLQNVNAQSVIVLGSVAVVAAQTWSIERSVALRMNVFLAVFTCALGAVLLSYAIGKQSTDGLRQRIFRDALIASVILAMGAFGFGVDPGPTYDTGRAYGGQFSLHEDQLNSYLWLRDNSDPYSRFITNKHCITGSILTQDCYPRWYLATAISERRTPVEGYSSTWKNVDGPYWKPSWLTQLDTFINHPARKVAKQLLAQRIEWIVIDKTLPYSEELRNYGTVVFERDYALLIHLKLGRTDKHPDLKNVHDAT
jgi:hypothetical protein